MRNYLCCTDFNRAGLNRLLSYVLTVYKECNVIAFPIDCFSILRHYGFKVLSYSELKEINFELYTICQSCTEDAFTYEKIVHNLYLKIDEKTDYDKTYRLAQYAETSCMISRAVQGNVAIEANIHLEKEKAS